MAIERHAALVEYPSSDGEPMADNTRQFQWIVTIQGGIDALFKDDPAIFVAGDLLWYPVEGRPDIRRAPDAMVVFGRPKGHRPSYMQWAEGNIAPQVVFEVRSPKNSHAELERKRQFYEAYSAEEYYLYDPDNGELTGWQRAGGRLSVIEQIEGWVSPRLGVRFGLHDGELLLNYPNGAPFLSYVELARRREAAEHARTAAEHARTAEHERAERMATRLRELGINPDTL